MWAQIHNQSLAAIANKKGSHTLCISNTAMNKTLFLFCSLLLIQSLQTIFSGLHVFYVQYLGEIS